MRRSLALAMLTGLLATAHAQTPRQPKVAPGPMEPNWDVVLETLYGLRMFDDLKNPVTTTPEATPGLFKKAGPGPVVYRPVVALGLETTTRGGWYAPGKEPKKGELWSYRMKNTTKDVETGANLPPRLAEGSKAEFDPGDAPFGLWVGNDDFKDGGVFTEPRLVAAINQRLAKQPYKAMIYPNKDRMTGKLIPHSYIIGWEYSTNDDFQDVVTRVDNVDLVESASK